MVGQVQECSVHGQQLMTMIARIIHLLIESPPDNIIELHKGFRRQVPARLTEAAFDDPSDVELFILRLEEKAVHLSL